MVLPTVPFVKFGACFLHELTQDLSTQNTNRDVCIDNGLFNIKEHVINA